MHVLIIDDHPLLRIGARHLVSAAWPDATFDEADALADGVRAFQARRPDVVLLDLQLPDATGIESAARMLRLAGEVPVLVVSQNQEMAFAARLLRLGVRGYLPKHRTADELVTALRRVLEGGRYMTPETAGQLVELLEAGPRGDGLPHEALSTQEFRVMQLIAAGRTPAQIGELMHLSAKTVGSYRARIFEKTGWRSTAELAKYCLQHGLTAPE